MGVFIVYSRYIDGGLLLVDGDVGEVGCVFIFFYRVDKYRKDGNVYR